MRGRTITNSFNGGEVSQRLEGRTDLDGIHDRAVAKMLNYVAQVEGPAMKRGGFRYIKAAASSSTWLTPFIFNTLQSYLVEWGEQRLRFFTNGGQIQAGSGPLEVAVPYSASQAPRVSTWQSYDRLYMAHPSHPPAMLSRTAAEAFAFDWIPLKNGPFKDWNADKSITISWTGTGLVDSTAVVTSSKAIFKEGHVGGPFIFECKDFSGIKAWEPNVRADDIDVGSLRRSDGKVYSFVGKGSAAGDYFTGSIQPTHNEGSEWDGSSDIMNGTENNRAGVKWLYEYDRYGIGQITKFLSANRVEIKVTRRFPPSNGSYTWALGCFSNAEGWPHMVCVWGQRLVFFKAGSNGIEIAGSVTGDLFNFSPLTPDGLFTPDMGFRRALGIADPPLWVYPDKEYLLAGSARSEIVVAPINRAAGISADNLQAQSQSGYGSAAAWPIPVGTALLFVQRGGRRIREATFSGDEQRFAGPNVNVYARHITRSGVKWMAFQQEPEEMLWGGRGDGVLIAHPHNPEQSIKGFSRAKLAQGSVLAGAVIPSQDGDRDELWILAELDGQKGILQLSDWWEEDPELTADQALEKLQDAFFVDWGVSYDGEPKQTFTTGLEHLEGKTVRILADGIAIEGKQVLGGSVTLPKPASKVHIGLGYQAVIRFLRPELRGVPSINGLRRRIVRFFTRLIDSASPILVDRRGEKEPMFRRPDEEIPVDKPKLFTGDTDNKAFGSGSGFEDVPEILSDDPYPSIISMAVATYDVEEFEQ